MMGGACRGLARQRWRKRLNVACSMSPAASTRSVARAAPTHLVIGMPS